MSDTLHVAVLEPYYGGSHAAFVEALKLRSRHRITLVTLPARKWKWRMRGAAVWFARDAADRLLDSDHGPIDAILCNDMLSVADLRALLPRELRAVPLICYFHENQLTYPMADDRDRDYQYGMTNITSCLAADAVWFNSQFHLNDFLDGAEWLLGKMPDFVPEHVIPDIRDKAAVYPPPVLARRVDRTDWKTRDVPTILWCHRWEYDKNPGPFFDALLRLTETGYDFRLVLLGQRFQTAPPVFASSWDRLRPSIVHTGHIPDPVGYQSALADCDIVVSTAIQENFGIAVVEAILAGCQPLLPDRLVYPEIIPKRFHQTCLYPSDVDLLGRLRSALDGPGRMTPASIAELQDSVHRRFAASGSVSVFDDGLVELAHRCKAGNAG